MPAGCTAPATSCMGMGMCTDVGTCNSCLPVMAVANFSSVARVVVALGAVEARLQFLAVGRGGVETRERRVADTCK